MLTTSHNSFLLIQMPHDLESILSCQNTSNNTEVGLPPIPCQGSLSMYSFRFQQRGQEQSHSADIDCYPAGLGTAPCLWLLA